MEIDRLNALLLSAYGSFRTAHMRAVTTVNEWPVGADSENGWRDGTIVEAFVSQNWGGQERFAVTHHHDGVLVGRCVNDGRDWSISSVRISSYMPEYGNDGLEHDAVVAAMLVHNLVTDDHALTDCYEVREVVDLGDHFVFTVARHPDKWVPQSIGFRLRNGEWWCDEFRATTGARGTLARVDARSADGTVLMTCQATVEFDIDLADDLFIVERLLDGD